MRVWTRLAVGFATTAFVIAGVYGTYQLRQEAIDLRAAADRELRLVGATVATAAADAFRDTQQADVREIADAMKVRDPSLDVLVFNAEGEMVAGAWGSSRVAAMVRSSVDSTRATNRTILEFEGPRGMSHLIGTFPINDANGSSVGTLALVRSLDELRRDLGTETRDTVLSLATLVVGLALTGWMLATIYVRNPLRDLVQTMRAVRAGDLTAKARFRHADELGEAVNAFNDMMGDLAQARRRLIAEAETREKLEASLQRTDKLVTVGQLSAGLAHEIGSPLQVLNGRARALAARADLSPEIRRNAEILARESDRITRIVDQLLTFSRYTAPRIADMPLGPPVQQIVEFFSPEAQRLGVQLAYACDDGLPPVRADAAQVQQVVMNLLMNAVHVTAPGGQVRVHICRGSFDLGAGVCSAVSLVVEDTGTGIPADVQPRIFEPFFTTRSQSGGTGLGLAVVKAIVDAHGGVIQVATEPGVGTRFTVQLPTADAMVAGGWVA
jgi:signal transduction histidine kinase